MVCVCVCVWLYRRQSLPLSDLTHAQLADHYADCIKLSTENVRSALVDISPLFVAELNSFYTNSKTVIVYCVNACVCFEANKYSSSSSSYDLQKILWQMLSYYCDADLCPW